MNIELQDASATRVHQLDAIRGEAEARDVHEIEGPRNRNRS